MNLTDLNNPRGITSIYIENSRHQHTVVLAARQGFQENKGSVELWEESDNGLMYRVSRWLKKSIVSMERNGVWHVGEAK